MTNILNKLLDIRNKIASLDIKPIKEQLKSTEDSYQKRIDDKLPKIIQSQNGKVSLNAGNEFIFIISHETIINFPFSLSLKSEIKEWKSKEPIFIDASKNLFEPIVNIIRYMISYVCAKNENTHEDIHLITNVNRLFLKIRVPTEQLKVKAKEFFGDDTGKIFDLIGLDYIPFWKEIVNKKKEVQALNKWRKTDYILCYSCGAENDGTFWKKKISYDRANDNYAIDNYIATCLVCDSNNTLEY